MGLNQPDHVLPDEDGSVRPIGVPGGISESLCQLYDRRQRHQWEANHEIAQIEADIGLLPWEPSVLRGVPCLRS